MRCPTITPIKVANTSTETAIRLVITNCWLATAVTVLSGLRTTYVDKDLARGSCLEIFGGYKD